MKAVKLEKGLTVALKLVGETTLRDIWGTVGDIVNNRYTNEIAFSIDGKKYQADKAKDDRALKLFEDSLTPDQQKLYTDFDSARCSRTYWEEVAAFYLGYATAIRFGQCAAAGVQRKGGKNHGN